MSKNKDVFKQYCYAVMWIAIFVGVIYWAVRHLSAFGNLLMVAIGFGAFVLIHESGHFLFAKLFGIKVEAFSAGFPPTLVGILRTERGWRIRILPQFFPKGDGSDDGRLSFTIGRKMHKPGETEYRIGVIPFGGFVKMLGQEDAGPIQVTNDPRSFANKSVGARMAVIAAGVVFNAISALIVFMIVFLIGINRVPAVIGGIVPDSPAARAGLVAGDEVIEIAGRDKDLDYYDIAVEAALSGRNEEINLKVKGENGSVRDCTLIAEQKPGAEVKEFGIVSPQSLVVAAVSDANTLLEKTGLRPGDRIKSVEGRAVRNYWEFEEIARNTIASVVTVKAERIGQDGKTEEVEAKIGLSLLAAEVKNEAESETGHICSMVPRLRLEAVSKKQPSTMEKLKASFGDKKQGEEIEAKPELQSGDIVLAAGDVNVPTYKELRDVTTRYEDKELPIRVLRTDANGVEEELTVTVTPKRAKDGRVVIGIFLVPAFDAEHPVVAKTITAEDWPVSLEIPRGAVITAVNKVEVSSFYDVVREIKNGAGKRVTIKYRMDEKTTGGVALDVKADVNFPDVKSGFADFVPFKFLERLYKASGPVNAIGMGYRKTVMFIEQAYITIKGLAGGLVSPKSLMGPVGIVSLSYKIVAERPLIDYVYFLGLISAFLAVFNILPLLPFDGGFVVFLLIEKIKGSPVSVRIQEKIASVGWLLVMALVVYVTFNDIIRSFFS